MNLAGVEIIISPMSAEYPFPYDAVVILGSGIERRKYILKDENGKIIREKYRLEPGYPDGKERSIAGAGVIRRGLAKNLGLAEGNANFFRVSAERYLMARSPRFATIVDNFDNSPQMEAKRRRERKLLLLLNIDCRGRIPRWWAKRTRAGAPLT